MTQDNKKVTGVKVDDDVIPADVVVIAMGPWSYKASSWFGVPQIRGQRAHSILVHPEKPVTAHALFVDYQPMSRDPEVYPRPDGDVYICGMGDKVPLPEDPKDIKPDVDKCNELKRMGDLLSSNLRMSTVKTRQACYLPMSPDGLPIIGKVPRVEGAYIATGHGCWGILNAPATGEAIAELIIKGKCSFLDLSPFDPARFD